MFMLFWGECSIQIWEAIIIDKIQFQAYAQTSFNVT